MDFSREDEIMTQVFLYLDNTTLSFYQQLSQCTGIPLEQVLSDALFKLAGELSLQALKNAEGSPFLS